MKMFTDLMGAWSWRPIRGCPGRYILASPSDGLTPTALAGTGSCVREYRVTKARDPVVVAELDDGGLISYRKPNGNYVHTLCDRKGFERKLKQLGIKRQRV